MNVWEIILIGIGLSMDAFAVSICKGMQLRRNSFGRAILVAAFFGGFQALMPFLGWLLGSAFAERIERIDHWIAFGLLVFIGAKMIYDAVTEEQPDGSIKIEGPSFGNKKEKGMQDGNPDGLQVQAVSTQEAAVTENGEDGGTEPEKEETVENPPLPLTELVLLAIATSIDALAVGVTFSFLNVEIISACVIIGATTTAISFAGVELGYLTGGYFRDKAQIFGGAILIALGIRILLTHLMGV